MRKFLLAILCLLCVPTVAVGTTYYVDKDSVGGTCNNINNGTAIDTPWCTISKANTTLTAGDTVNIRVGTYNEQIAPSNSGSSGNIITYQAYDAEVVTISDIDTAVDLDSRSYVQLKDLIIDDVDKFVVMEGGDYNEFDTCTFSNMRNFDQWQGFQVGTNSDYVWIHDCTIHTYGYFDVSNDYGNMVYLGDSGGAGTCTGHLVEDNTFYYAGHSVLVIASNKSVIRNNYFHNEAWYDVSGTDYGNRCLEIRDNSATGQGTWNLFENNRIAFSDIATDTDYTNGIQCTSNNNIFRYNSLYATKGPALQIEINASFPSPAADDNYIYNNVFFYNGIGSVPTNRDMALWLRANATGNGPIDNTVIKNNIFYETVGDDIEISEFSPSTVTNTTDSNNWKAGNGNPLFVDADTSKTTDPFDAAYPDFTLSSGSSCIDGGTYLTTVHADDTGSGTSLILTDAHYFQDGWADGAGSDGSVAADWICVGTTVAAADCFQVGSINYGTNTITVADFSREDGDYVWLYKDSNGKRVLRGDAPDQGAEENEASIAIDDFGMVIFQKH